MNFEVIVEFVLAALNFVLMIIGILEGWHLWPLNLAACVVCFAVGLNLLRR